MAIYLELRKDANKRGENAIRIVILTDRNSASRRNTGYAVNPKFWDEKKQRIKSAHPNSVSWNAALEAKLSEAREQFAKLDAAGKKPKAEKIARAVEIGGKFKLIAMYYADKFRAEGKIGTSDRYKSLAEGVEELYPRLLCSDMDSDWCEAYRLKLIEKKQLHNTIVGKLKTCSAILTKAASDNLIPGNQMKGYKIGTYKKSDKEALDLDEIERLWRHEPSGYWERMARLTFLFSYYATGARFKDVLLMPQKSVYSYNKAKRLKWQPNKTRHSTGNYISMPEAGLYPVNVPV